MLVKIDDEKKMLWHCVHVGYYSIIYENWIDEYLLDAEWCFQVNSDCEIYFKDVTDAVAFKLRWS